MNTFFIQYKKHIISFCILFVLTFVLYYQTLFFGFFSDDYHFLYVMSQTDSMWKFFLTNNVGGMVGGSYGPVLDVLWGIQYRLFDIQAIWYHVVLLSAYAVTAWFIYLFIYRLSNIYYISFIGGLLFLVLQNHTSAVSWISVMPHVWATLFFVIAWYGYYRYVTKQISWWYVISFVSILLSLFTKEIAILFPLIFVLTEIVFGDRKIISIIKHQSIFIVGWILYIVIRRSMVGYVAGYYASDIGWTLMPKIHMFVELTLSMGLSSPYRQMMTEWSMNNIVIWTIIGIMIMAIVIYTSGVYRRIVGWLIGVYILLSIPFVNLAFDQTSDSGERYGYILSVIFIMILVIWLYAMSTRVSWGRVWFIIVIVIMMIGGFAQMYGKHAMWQHSGELRDRVLFDIQTADIQNDDYIIFIGTGDNIAGVEHMRNAIREMIDLETDKGYVDGDRIPLYVEPRAVISDSGSIYETVELRHIDTWSYELIPRSSGVRMFTGFPVYEHESGTYELKNFQHYDHSGTSIYMTLNQEFLRTQDSRVILAYFDGAHMQFVTIFGE